MTRSSSINLTYLGYVIGLIMLTLWVIFLLFQKSGIIGGDENQLSAINTSFPFEQEQKQAHKNTGISSGNYSAEAGKPIPKNTPSQDQSSKVVNNLSKDFIIQQQLETNNTLEEIRKLGYQQNQKLGTYSLSVIEHLYEKTKKKDLLGPLVQLASQQFLFEKAYNYLQILDTEAINYVSAQTILYVLFNIKELSPKNTFAHTQISNTVLRFHTKGYISDEDKHFFLTLLHFLQQDIKTFQQDIVQGMGQKKYLAFYEGCQKIFDMRTTHQDLPREYFISLFALEILKKGYFQIPKEIAVQIRLQNEDYILPQQILGYASFVLQQWGEAQDYFLELQQHDTVQTPLYNFLLGISYFRQEKYADAIIVRKQIFLIEYRLDKLRYLSLAYNRIDDTQNMIKTFGEIFEENNLQPVDFYTVFERVFYQPYRQQEAFVLFTQHHRLIDQYISHCFASLPEDEQYVCRYGEAGKLLSQGKLEAMAKILTSLTESIEKAYLYQALGEYYFQEGYEDQAKQAYIKALSLPATMQEQQFAKEQLLRIAQMKQ